MAESLARTAVSPLTWYNMDIYGIAWDFEADNGLQGYPQPYQQHNADMPQVPILPRKYTQGYYVYEKSNIFNKLG